jgi:IS1 family transposase
LPEEKVLSILEHITEGCGVLKTARLVKVHPATVSCSTRTAAAQARAAHDELVAHSPETREIPRDEEWSFVARKEKNCDEDQPEDRWRGDCWDHVAYDPEHRLVVSVVPGQRTAESVQELVGDLKERSRGRAPELITTDEYSPDEGAILEAFGEVVVPPRTGKPARPRKPYKVAPEGLNSATVHKTRKKGTRGGDAGDLRHRHDGAGALAASVATRTINTAFLERHNGTDRNRNARKVRKTYCFSKDGWIQRSATFFSKSRYNFCWPMRTPKAKGGAAQPLAWTLTKWIQRPAVQLVQVTARYPTPAPSFSALSGWLLFPRGGSWNTVPVFLKRDRAPIRRFSNNASQPSAALGSLRHENCRRRSILSPQSPRFGAWRHFVLEWSLDLDRIAPATLRIAGSHS